MDVFGSPGRKQSFLLTQVPDAFLSSTLIFPDSLRNEVK